MVVRNKINIFTMNPFVDSAEAQNILDKYRKLTHAENSPNATNASSSAVDGNATDSVIRFGQDEVSDQLNIHCEKFMFENAKKKLRFVLSNTEIQQLPCTSKTLQGLVSVFVYEKFLSRDQRRIQTVTL